MRSLCKGSNDHTSTTASGLVYSVRALAVWFTVCGLSPYVVSLRRENMDTVPTCLWCAAHITRGDERSDEDFTERMRAAYKALDEYAAQVCGT
jgi:hypothetical protein